MSQRILLGQLAANGDCLYATTIARQIKTDFPGCHLTWAISSRCRSMIEGNPDVDEVWEIALLPGQDLFEQWQHFEVEAKKRAANGDFDEIFLTQISPANYRFWTGSVRAAILRAYPRPITVDTTPLLRLSTLEIEGVARFARKHRLAEKAGVILFECAPRSQQSRVNPQFALDVARRVVAGHPQVAVILSSNHPFVSPHENIIDASALSLRDNAELTKHCSLFIGCSSGITWIATSDWAKPLPMLQLVRPDLARSNSLIYDFEQRGCSTSSTIELSSYSLDEVVECVNDILLGKFEQAKQKFQQQTPFKFGHYIHIQYFLVLRKKRKESKQFLELHVQEFGCRFQFTLLLIFVHLKCIAATPVKFLKNRLQNKQT